MTIWAGVLPCLADISCITSSFKILTSYSVLIFILFPMTSGVYAIGMMPFFWATYTTWLLGKYGWISFCKATGLILANESNSMINCPLKFEIPKCFTYPFVTHDSISAHTSSKGLWLNSRSPVISTKGQCKYNRSRCFNCISCKISLTSFCTFCPFRLNIFEAMNNYYRFTRPYCITVLIAFPKAISLL